jgi:hypothetical protein
MMARIGYGTVIAVVLALAAGAACDSTAEAPTTTAPTPRSGPLPFDASVAFYGFDASVCPAQPLHLSALDARYDSVSTLWTVSVDETSFVAREVVFRDQIFRNASAYTDYRIHIIWGGLARFFCLDLGEIGLVVTTPNALPQLLFQ